MRYLLLLLLSICSSVFGDSIEEIRLTTEQQLYKTVNGYYYQGAEYQQPAVQQRVTNVPHRFQRWPQRVERQRPIERTKPDFTQDWIPKP